MYQYLPPSKSISIATTIFEINHQTTWIAAICSDVACFLKPCNKMSQPVSLIRDTSTVIISEYETIILT